MHVPPHQLPDQRQGVHRTPLIQIFSSDADQREVSNIPAQPHGIVTVLQLRCEEKQCYIHFNFQANNFFSVPTDFIHTTINTTRVFASIFQECN